MFSRDGLLVASGNNEAGLPRLGTLEIGSCFLLSLPAKFNRSGELSRIDQLLIVIDGNLPGTCHAPDYIGAGSRLHQSQTGSRNPLLKVWIGLSARAAPRTGSGHLLNRVFDELAGPRAAGRCIKCHTIDRTAEGTLQTNWVALQRDPYERRSTRFSHLPHLNTMRNESCRTCHACRTRCD